MKKNLILLALVLFHPNFSSSEPYEATPVPFRSLKYINSFGFFYDYFDFLIIPRLITETIRPLLITNLTNLSSPHAFQGGYLHPSSIGSFSLYLNLYFEKSGAESLQETLRYLDSDYAEITTTITREKYEGGRYIFSPYRKLVDLTGGISYGRKIGGISFGIGGAFLIGKLSEDFKGINLPLTGFSCPENSYVSSGGLCSGGFYPFSESPLQRREIRRVNLFTSTEEFMEEREAGTEEDSSAELSILGGVSFDISSFYSMSLDGILGVGRKGRDGEGEYFYQFFYESSVSSVSLDYLERREESFYFLRSGISLKNTFSVKGGLHTLHLDLGYERKTPFDENIYSDGENKYIHSSPVVFNSLEERGMIFWDGKTETEDSFLLSLRDVYYIRFGTYLGFGFEGGYNFNRKHFDSFWRYSSSEIFNDRDNEFSDPDDYSSTATGIIPLFLKERERKLFFSFPVVFSGKVGRDGEFLIGGRFTLFHIQGFYIRYMKTSDIFWKKTIEYGDGRIEEIRDIQAGEFILKGNEIKFNEQSRWSEVRTAVHLRAGMGYYFFKKALKIYALLSSGIGDEGVFGLKSSFAEFYLSAIINF